MTDDPYAKKATHLQGVDTILALPQSYLDYRLDRLLRTGKTPDGHGLMDVRLPINDSGKLWLTGRLSKLGIQVVVPGSAGKVVFTVAFASGTMDYYDVQTVPPEPRKCDIAGLQIGFLVDLAKAGVHPADYRSLPTDVQAKAAGLPSGSFTIQQLFLDLERADLTQYDSANTVFPKSMPPSAKSAFTMYMATYLQWITAANGHVLGYTVVVPNWDDPVASFPPSSLDFATNEYRTKKPAPADKARDCVLYLMMTGKAPLPGNLQPWWGNFVLPQDGSADGWYGAMAMARHLFVDGYLADQLSGLVCGYLALADNNDGLHLVGSYRTGMLTSKTGGLTFNSGGRSGKSHRTNTFSNDDVVTTMYLTVSVVYQPGTAQLVINRRLNFDIDYTHWYGIEGNAAKTSFRVWYQVPQELTVTLIGVVDGKLQVEVTEKSPQPDPGTLYDLPMGHLVTRTEGSASIWASVSDTLDSTVDTIVSTVLDVELPPRIEQVIAERLNLSPFVFPGGAQLNLVNPLFNDAGDLLFGVSQKS